MQQFGYLYYFDDIEITAREIGKLKKELYEIISLHSGQKIPLGKTVPALVERWAADLVVLAI